MRKIAVWLLILVVWVWPAQAQTAGWMAWLFDGETGVLTQVRADGTGSTLLLPMPPGFDTFFRRVAVGRGGGPFAYIVYNNTSFQGQLAVADSSGSVLTRFNLPLTLSDTFEFNTGEELFNEDNSALAFGYSLDGGGWAIIVLETRLNGTVTAVLRSDDVLAGMLGLPGGFGLTPVVRQFVGRAVTFTLVQSGTEGQPYYDSYTWDLNANTITMNPAFPSLDADTWLPTGETVMSLSDDRLPNQSETFIFWQANTLHVYDPLSAARFPFYSAPAESLYWPRFIQNGELILVSGSPASGTSSQWRVIRRDGSLVGLLPTSLMLNDVAGVADGFIYTTDAFNPGATTLVYVNTRDGLDAGVPVWTGAPGMTPLIVWVGGDAPTAQAAVSAWAALAEPVYLSGSLIPAAAPTLVPTAIQLSPGQLAGATPIVGGFLAPGGLALVNTTEGDQLNVRQGPGTAYTIVGKLPDGARVSVLDGPRYADGFTWWKIRAATGLEGWAVEGVIDNGALLQTLLPG